jgi:tRNA dimethylallyltransferase
LTKTVIIIAGPTAVGKTAVAIEIAKQYNTEIISADSRQCYKELDIGVARPSPLELASIPHHFITSHSIHQTVNAGVFEQYALEKTEQVFRDNNILVMVGGTGLYIKAFCEGIDDIPAVPSSIRNEVTEGYNKSGLSWLQHQVKILDPEFYEVGEVQNPQRMMRALEVFKTTGKSILYFRKGKKTERNFSVIKLGLELPKELLYQNINIRVDAMIEAGLLNEVKSLMPYQHLNALQTVGYKELFDYLNGKVHLMDAIASIKKHTRQYAKRQLTWFKKDKEYTWFYPGHLQKIKEHLSDALIYK